MCINPTHCEAIISATKATQEKSKTPLDRCTRVLSNDIV
jgi:hypothetical protein